MLKERHGRVEVGGSLAVYCGGAVGTLRFSCEVDIELLWHGDGELNEMAIGNEGRRQ